MLRLTAPDGAPARPRRPRGDAALRLDRPQWTEREGFEPSTHLSARTRFPVALLRPLGHLSGASAGYPIRSVVDTGHQVLALDYAHPMARSNQPHVVPGLARIQHLVARFHGAHLRTDRGDD